MSSFYIFARLKLMIKDFYLFLFNSEQQGMKTQVKQYRRQPINNKQKQQPCTKGKIQSKMFKINFEIINKVLIIVMQDYVGKKVFANKYTNEDIFKHINPKLQIEDIFEGFLSVQNKIAHQLLTQQKINQICKYGECISSQYNTVKINQDGEIQIQTILFYPREGKLIRKVEKSNLQLQKVSGTSDNNEKHKYRQQKEQPMLFRQWSNRYKQEILRIEKIKRYEQIRRMEQYEDIGIFSKNAGAISYQQILSSQKYQPTSEELHDLIKSKNADPQSNFLKYDLDIPLQITNSLIQLANKQLENRLLSKCTQQETDDLKFNLTHQQLLSIIGRQIFDKLFDLFGTNISEIIVRRCQSHGKLIDFHTDYSLKTLQLSLNNDSEYVGGRLLYVTNGKVEIPVRKRGTVTVHNNRIVHGVTRLESGIRFGLFFLNK